MSQTLSTGLQNRLCTRTSVKLVSFKKFYLAQFHKLGLQCNVTETLPYRDNTPSRNVRNVILIDQYCTNTQRQLVIRNQDVCIKVITNTYALTKLNKP